mmetsp:Transcript_36341/g.95358  ORF Transcript_36341/g.95358 Transcript_36341/m.95358 type:complete len:244 (-) Transcript_36341:5112-5843(-)
MRAPSAVMLLLPRFRYCRRSFTLMAVTSWPHSSSYRHLKKVLLSPKLLSRRSRRSTACPCACETADMPTTAAALLAPICPIWFQLITNSRTELLRSTASNNFSAPVEPKLHWRKFRDRRQGSSLWGMTDFRGAITVTRGAMVPLFVMETGMSEMAPGFTVFLVARGAARSGRAKAWEMRWAPATPSGVPCRQISDKPVTLDLVHASNRPAASGPNLLRPTSIDVRLAFTCKALDMLSNPSSVT